MVNPASATGDSSSRNLRDDLDALKADLGTLKDDLRTFSSDAVNAARHGASAARTGFGQAASAARDKARAAYDSAREKGQAAKDEVEGKIQDHPFTSVGIAFGVGIGALIARGKFQALAWNMYRHLSQFVVKIANLAEAEGRELRHHVGRLTIGFALGMAAAGMLLGGALLILLGIWLGLAHGAGMHPAWASVITGILALALAGGGFALVVKMVK